MKAPCCGTKVIKLFSTINLAKLCWLLSVFKTGKCITGACLTVSSHSFLITVLSSLIFTDAISVLTGVFQQFPVYCLRACQVLTFQRDVMVFRFSKISHNDTNMKIRPQHTTKCVHCYIFMNNTSQLRMSWIFWNITQLCIHVSVYT
jgi:hypothetical protein